MGTGTATWPDLDGMQAACAAADARVETARGAWYDAQDEMTAALRAVELAVGPEAERARSRATVCERMLGEQALRLAEAKNLAASARQNFDQWRRRLEETQRLTDRVTRLYARLEELRQASAGNRQSFAGMQLARELDEHAETLEGLHRTLQLAHPNLWQLAADVQALERRLDELGSQQGAGGRG